VEQAAHLLAQTVLLVVILFLIPLLHRACLGKARNFECKWLLFSSNGLNR
jgi:hypothetical protein